MIYHRATVGAHQMWADQVGDASYKFKNFLPYLKKSVTYTPPNNVLRLQNASTSYDVSSLQGSGPLSVTFANWVYAFPTWAARAFTQIGIPFRPDGLQDGSLLGYAYTLYTLDAQSQTRASSETAFLSNSLDEPNYYVYPLTMAKKILFDSSRKATGVLVDTAGAQYSLSARKEVILSAGCIGSPQLLQVSGVGPAALLSSHSIPVIADRPGVGQNLQDQIVFGISRGVNAPTASSYDSAAYSAAQAALFDSSAAGPLTDLGADMTAWEKVTANMTSVSSTTRAALARYPADWPDLEYITFAGYFGNCNSFTTADPGDGIQYATMAVALGTPLSRGSVAITSPDAAVAPVIDPQFLTNPGDIEVAVAGFKRARQFWSASSIQPFLVGKEKYPGPEVTTDAQIAESIRNSFTTIYHGASTCAMGRANDSLAVVDPQARVYGVSGLRVVDASAFPFLPPGHPQSTVCKYLVHALSFLECP